MQNGILQRLVLACLAVGLLVFLAACLTPTPPAAPTVEPTLPSEVPPELSIIWETWRALRQDFVDRQELDPQELSRGAVRGMLEALEDPYAAYLDPEHYAQELEDFRGYFEGIGAEVTMRRGRIIILAPIPDTPAERAGIRPGDVILAIDGESTEGITLHEAVRKIRGPQGTPVTLSVQHIGEREPVTITIVRDVIRVTSVSFQMLSDRIVYLRLSTFRENTDEEMASALRQIRRQGARGIVLDLRNNPGGLLETVVRVTSQFLREGLVLYEVDGRGQRTDWRVRRGALAPAIPLVVLVNDFSASGSEVLAGALRDHGRAKLVGVQTFGKGSVNTLKALSDGSGIYFTVSRWYTPNGTLIEGEGLEPDVVVEQPRDAPGDPQLEKAIEILKAETGGLP